MAIPDFTQKNENQIYTIDTGFVRPKMTASYLITHQGRAAFVDVATALTIPRLLQSLQSLNISYETVEFICLTHIHLDHAGAAGSLMKYFPNAKCVVHPRAARHIIDPSQLILGATKVFGAEAMKNNYGEILPVPEDKLIIIEDSQILKLGDRLLQFFDTPGHAKHHYCIFDKTANVIFTGDTFGLSYPKLNSHKHRLIIPTTTPIHFDPQAMHDSINKLISLKPESAFLTHFGRQSNLAQAANDLHLWVDIYVKITEAAKGNQEIIYQALVDATLEKLQQAEPAINKQVMLEQLDYDLQINAQGLNFWYKRR